ncbi:MAG: hypothetical protein ABSA17_03490 [Rhabdochlamydiaceae bacterium]
MRRGRGTPELARRGGNAIAAGGCSDNVKSKRERSERGGPCIGIQAAEGGSI